MLLEAGGRMTHHIEFEREEDGRWIAVVPEIPGVMSYGATKREATVRVKSLTLRVVADMMEHDELATSLTAINDGEEIGPRALAEIAKRTGLKPEDL